MARARRSLTFVVAALALARAPAARADEPGGKGEKMRCIHAAEEAQQLRVQKRLRDAKERLDVCSREVCPTLVKKDCRTWRADVDAQMPSFVVKATDGRGNDVTDVTVKVDGVTVAERLDGYEIAVDPGEHTVELHAASGPVLTEKLLAVLGEKRRLVTATFPASGEDRPAVSATPGPEPMPAAPVAETPKEPVKGRTWPWIVLGVGGGVALAGAAVGVSGYVEYQNFKDTCAPSCDESNVDSVRARTIAGDVALGVGLVTVGVATYFLLTQPKASRGAQGVFRVLGGSF